MATAADSSLLNLVIRMVVPLRREFGRSLDVQLFLRDDAYARTVLDQALAAQDQRLRDYAQSVHRHLAGPRGGDPPLTSAAHASGATPPAAAAPAAVAPAADATEAELRARMLRKYTGGLR